MVKCENRGAERRPAPMRSLEVAAFYAYNPLAAFMNARGGPVR